MTDMLNSNQFLQGKNVGFCDRNTCAYNPIPVVVAKSQATPIAIGFPVTLASTKIDTLPQVIASTGATAQDVFGFTFYHTHINKYGAGARTAVLPLGSGAIIYLKAKGAIATGDLVAYNVSTQDVSTATSGNVIVGQALIGATGAGDLIPVMLNVPVGTEVAGA